MPKQNKSGSGSRKHGRNATFCLSYHSRARRETNKKLKMERHMRRFPNDGQTVNAMRSIEDKRINALRATV